MSHVSDTVIHSSSDKAIPNAVNTDEAIARVNALDDQQENQVSMLLKKVIFTLDTTHIPTNITRSMIWRSSYAARMLRNLNSTKRINVFNVSKPNAKTTKRASTKSCLITRRLSTSEANSSTSRNKPWKPKRKQPKNEILKWPSSPNSASRKTQSIPNLQTLDLHYPPPLFQKS